MLVELGHLPDRYLSPANHETPNWFQFLPQYITSHMAFTGTPSQLLAQALIEGRCLLLFDGLDEVADRSVRARLARSVAELAYLSSGNRIVIGSRIAGVSESAGILHPQFQRCQIERFTPSEVWRFFRFWYLQDHGLSYEQQRAGADELYNKVQITPGILQLATTPLLSMILLLIWRNEGSLPGKRSDLYKHCCQILIEKWEAHHDVAYQGVLAHLGWERHLRLLAPLAYAIHSQEQQTNAGRTELVPWLVKSLQKEGLCQESTKAILEAEQFLASLSLRSGLLQYLGNDRYSFLHLTFQEYLAARYIAEQKEYINLVIEHLQNAWWQEVHLLTIGHLGSEKETANKASDLLLEILRFHRPPWWFFRSTRHNLLRLITPGKYLPHVQLERHIAWLLGQNLEFCLRGYLECVPGSNPLMEETRKLLLAQTVSYVRRILRDEAYCQDQQHLLPFVTLALQLQGSKEIAQLLLSAMSHAWPHLQAKDTAIGILSQIDIDSKIVIRAMIEALDYSSTRVIAAETLGRVGKGNEAVVRALLETGRNSVDLEFFFAVIQSLRQVIVSNEATIQILCEALRSESTMNLLAASSLQAVEVGNETVIQALLVSLHSYDQGLFPLRRREQAISGLRDVGIGNEKVIQALLEVLRDDDQYIRKRAVESLSLVGAGNKVAIQALFDTLHDHHWSVRCAAVKGLSQVGAGNEIVMLALLKALHDEKEEVRCAAAESLSQVGAGNEIAMQALLDTLHDHHWSVRYRALKALCQKGVVNETAIQSIHYMLHDSNGIVRVAAAGELIKMKVGNEEVVKILLEAVNSYDSTQSKAAAQNLALLGISNEMTIETLSRSVHDSDWVLSGAARKVLHQLVTSSDTAIQTLCHMLHDPNPSVRIMAARVLGQIGISNEAVIQELGKALHDRDAIVRVAASRSLGQIEIENPDQLHWVLLALNRCLYYYGWVYSPRQAIFTSMNHLLQRRPFPSSN
jgi:HEAT repeat protein